MKKFFVVLSFLFVFVLVLTVPNAQAAQTPTPEFFASINVVNMQESNSGEKGNEKKYNADESGTGTVLIVSNAIARLLKDDDGDEEYPKMSFKFDLDVNETTDYYAIFYLSFHDGYNSYGWFTFDSIKTAVYTLEEGSSAEEGVLDLDLYFISGYQMKMDVKVEVYYNEDGSLAATYGPDDDPDLKDIPVESGDYDIKEDPFATTPTPTSTPTPFEPNTISVDP